MSSPASVKGHPIHPMLVAFPIALFVFSLIADIIGLARPGNAAWGFVALYCMIAGIVGALLAAVPGFVDLLSLRDAATKRVALIHMSFNLIVVVLFVINAWLRVAGNATALPFILSIIGVALLAVAGWLGGEMVYVHAVAVATRPTTTADRSYVAEEPRRAGTGR